MSRRSSYLAALITLVLAGLAVLWASQQPWITIASTSAWGSADVESVAGSRYRPIVAVLGPFAMASALALIATRLWGRRIVGGVLLLLALASLISVATVWGAGDINVGPVLVAGLSSALIAVGAIATVALAGSWPMLSRRYERTPTPSAWAQLDAGEDPTLAPPSRDWMGS